MLLAQLGPEAGFAQGRLHVIPSCNGGFVQAAHKPLHPGRHIHVGLAGGRLQLGVIACPVQPHLLRQVPQAFVSFEVLRQRRTLQAVGLVLAVVEPIDQPRHLFLHIRRVRCLVVDDVWLAQAGRDDLHRFGMVAVGTCANLLNTAAPIGKQGGL